MSGVSNTINSAKDSVFGFADDLSGALDFGSSAPEREPTKQTVNPEMDISEIDRANPTNLNGGIFGVPTSYIMYGVAAIAALIVVKKVL